VDSQPQTAAAAATPSVRGGLIAAMAICAVTLLVAIFELSMADWPSSFVAMLLLPLTALPFLGCSVWSLTQLLRMPRDGVKFAAPFVRLHGHAGAPDLRPAAADLPTIRLPLAPRGAESDRGAGRARRTEAQCRPQR